ncbi:MAG: queuosine precursor transporter [Desulfovibrio sp.]|uniref:queuosine precursor transporter n=1 Tax=Desulfovibrio sp. 7SRBS1 TaxID=3378064 RepID=UPI003B3E2464
MNEVLWVCFALLDLIMVLAVFRYFGRIGLYGLIVFNLIVCNIQVLKTIELFGVTTTLGNIMYASVFLSTDLLSEHYGREHAKKGVWLGFFMLVLTIIYMQLAIHFVPAPSDWVQPHIEAIYGFMPRIALASLAAYFLSQMHDVWAFHFWKDKTQGRHLWLRNNASTLVSQLLDSSIFCFIAFVGVYPWPVFWEILWTTYVIKMIMGLADTPFIYLAGRLKPKEELA